MGVHTDVAAANVFALDPGGQQIRPARLDRHALLPTPPRARGAIGHMHLGTSAAQALALRVVEPVGDAAGTLRRSAGRPGAGQLVSLFETVVLHEVP